ncbi:killer toxin, Kp4/SMK-like protein, core [Whalleya microplaca]|nr:killer toxin, Kp4/SMK-like protein, core [Whalleya microplaca]
MYNFNLSKAAITILVVALGTTEVAALGINCRGSGNCSTACIRHALSEINTGVQYLPDGNNYPNGQHIACTGNCCAYLQNIAGTKTGRQVKTYVQSLLAHGCDRCGSVPTEDGNNVNTGELTVNWVPSP